jgi:hypothetical protein
MTDDTDPHSLPPEDLAQLRARAAVSSARARELIKQLRELEALMTSLRAENARLQSEVCFLRLARRKVDPFP